MEFACVLLFSFLGVQYYILHSGLKIWILSSIRETNILRMSKIFVRRETGYLGLKKRF